MMPSDLFTVEMPLEAGDEWTLTLAGATLAYCAVGSAELVEDESSSTGFAVRSITFCQPKGKRFCINERESNWALSSMFTELAQRIEASIAAKQAWADGLKERQAERVRRAA